MTLTQLAFLDGDEKQIRSAPNIVAAQYWASNGHLIADCARLGYLRADWLTLDATYGEGTWWSVWRPDRLVTNDRHKPADHAYDFRDMPLRDDTFDAVTFDPPYVVRGGRTTAGVELADTNHRYGVGHGDEARTPAEGQDRINDGLHEMCRLLRPGGHLLVKVQDYVSSGGLFLGTYKTLDTALSLGFRCLDRALYLAPIRPQPHQQQQHLRNNVSTLWVFRKAPR